jgi:hypothetical protein
MEQLVQQISQELKTDIGSANLWQLRKGDQAAAPPPVDGEVYGLVPKEIATRVNLELINKGTLTLRQKSGSTVSW